MLLELFVFRCYKFLFFFFVYFLVFIYYLFFVLYWGVVIILFEKLIKENIVKFIKNF